MEYRCGQVASEEVVYGKKRYDVCRSHYDDVLDGEALTLCDFDSGLTGYAPGVLRAVIPVSGDQERLL